MYRCIHIWRYRCLIIDKYPYIRIHLYLISRNSFTRPLYTKICTRMHMILHLYIYIHTYIHAYIYKYVYKCMHIYLYLISGNSVTRSCTTSGLRGGTIIVCKKRWLVYIYSLQIDIFLYIFIHVIPYTHICIHTFFIYKDVLLYIFLTRLWTTSGLRRGTAECIKNKIMIMIMIMIIIIIMIVLIITSWWS
jgi:hypothetical protein